MKNKYAIAGGVVFGIILAVEAGTVAFAQGSAVKNIGSEMATSSTTTPPSAESQVFGRGVDTVKNAVPESVKNTANGIFAKLNDFRSREYVLVEIARFYNIEQIDILNQKEIAVPAEFTWKNHIERILRYMHWMFLVLAWTILAHAWIFYSVLFLIVYSILRAMWRRVRRSGIHSDT